MKTLEEQQSLETAQQIYHHASQLLDAPAWKDYLVPKVEKKIQDIERAIIENEELDGAELKEARKQRAFLLDFLKWPERDQTTQGAVIDQAGAKSG